VKASNISNNFLELQVSEASIHCEFVEELEISSGLENSDKLQCSYQSENCEHKGNWRVFLLTSNKFNQYLSLNDRLLV